jgi:hypothetical protein
MHRYGLRLYSVRLEIRGVNFDIHIFLIGVYLGFHPLLVGFHFSFHFGHDGFQTFEIRLNYPSCGFKSDGAQFTPIDQSIQSYF